jgi:hypothetical protein
MRIMRLLRRTWEVNFGLELENLLQERVGVGQVMSRPVPDYEADSVSAYIRRPRRRASRGMRAEPVIKPRRPPASGSPEPL